MSTITKRAKDASAAKVSEANISTSGLLASPVIQNVLPFVIGGGSGMVATFCVQPIDVVKVRLQLAGEGSKAALAGSPFSVGRAIVRDGRFVDLWAGLSAGLLRQASYATLRLGLFDRFLVYFESSAKEKGKTIGFRQRAAASVCAGGLSAAIANPAEVALIRMQSDGMKPKAERANYRSVVDALVRVGRHEGLRGLWGGSFPTIIRAMSSNFGQLAFFSESKSQLKKHTNLSFQNQTFAASTIAGFFAALFSLPFDIVKTRLQRGTSNNTGARQYKGMLDCAIKILRDEGPLRFYRGFGTYFFRLAPHSIITLIVADNIHAFVKQDKK